MTISFTRLLAIKSLISHKVNQGTSLSDLHQSASEELEVMSIMLFDQNIKDIVDTALRNDAFEYGLSHISEGCHFAVQNFNASDLIQLVKSNTQLTDKSISFSQAISSLTQTTRFELNDSDLKYLSFYNDALSRIDAISRFSVTPTVSSIGVFEDDLVHVCISNALVVVTIKSSGNVHAVSDNAYVIVTSERRVNFVRTQSLDKTEDMVAYMSYPTKSAAKSTIGQYGIIIYNNKKESYSLVPTNELTIDDKIAYVINFDGSNIASINYQTIKADRVTLGLDKTMFTWDDEFIGLIIHSYITFPREFETALPGSKLFDDFSEKL